MPTRPDRLSLALCLAVSALLVPAEAGASSGRGVVGGEVKITLDGAPKADRSGAVVYLENVPGDAPPPAAHPKVAQKNLSFVPPLTVIETGESIDFPNEDRVFHNVFSLSRAARFDLGLYQSGSSKTVTFKYPGVVDVYCNIHPQMVAKIKVVDSHYHAQTGPDGRFRIENVPAGTWPVVVWLPSGDEYRGQVKVAAGGATQLQVEIAEHPTSTRHLRKDGTPYGRYK